MRTKQALGSAVYLVRRAIWALCMITLACSACGVREHPHPHSDGANDFAPTAAIDVVSKQNHRQASPDAAMSDGGMQQADGGMQHADGGMQPANRGAPAADGGTVGTMQEPTKVTVQGGARATADATAGVGGGGARDSSPHAAEGGVGTPAPDEAPTPPPPEMPALVLDGVPLRKEDVLAFIHFGHSNMAGMGTDPPELRPYFFTEKHPRVWMYRVGKPPQLAIEPTARTDNEQTAGPGIALLKQAAELAPNKYFMSLGYGAGGQSCSAFKPGGPYFDEFTKAAIAIKDRVTFAAIVIMIGNLECLAEDDVGRGILPGCINEITTKIRELLGLPDLPMLISGFEVEGTGVYSVEYERVRKTVAALESVPDLVSTSAIVRADGIPMQDDHHFSLAGHMLWTKRLLDIMQAKRWAPWATMAPTTATPGDP
ncbi:MAG TPA: sialate O-acetylesterase [Polyangiales bacterium]|nr:sialate O-acetylesterase [Polyangiales bacterium]